MGVLLFRDLKRLRKQANRNLMKLKGKCQFLPRGGTTPCTSTGCGLLGWKADWQRSTWWTRASNTSLQEKVASSILGCIRSTTTTSRSRERILPLCSALVTSTRSAGSCSGLPTKRQTWTCWSEPNEGSQRWLRDLGMFIKGKAERAGRKLKVILLMRVWKRLSTAQQKHKRQKALTETEQIPHKYMYIYMHT